MSTIAHVELDALDHRLAELFPGQIVRKDLVRSIKAGFNVPVYVLEYLLGKYCSSTDPTIIAEGQSALDALTNQTLTPAEKRRMRTAVRAGSPPRVG